MLPEACWRPHGGPMARAHRTDRPAALIGPRPQSGPAHGIRGAAGAVRHLGWDKTECPPLPPTGGDGKPAQLERAHHTVLPAALIRPRPQSESGPAHGIRGAAGAVRHLGSDKTECPPLPPTGGDGTPAQLARAHHTVLPAALIRPRPHWQSGPGPPSQGGNRSGLGLWKRAKVFSDAG